MPPHKEIKRCKKTPTWRTSTGSKISLPDNELFFSKGGGGVEGRKLTLPLPLCGRPCLYYIYFLRECSRKMYSKTHQIEQ